MGKRKTHPSGYIINAKSAISVECECGNQKWTQTVS